MSEKVDFMDIFLSPLLLSTAIAMQDAEIEIEDDFITDLLTMELEYWLEENKKLEPKEPGEL